MVLIYNISTYSQNVSKQILATLYKDIDRRTGRLFVPARIALAIAYGVCLQSVYLYLNIRYVYTWLHIYTCVYLYMYIYCLTNCHNAARMCLPHLRMQDACNDVLVSVCVRVCLFCMFAFLSACVSAIRARCWCYVWNVCCARGHCVCVCIVINISACTFTLLGTLVRHYTQVHRTHTHTLIDVLLYSIFELLLLWHITWRT